MLRTVITDIIEIIIRYIEITTLRIVTIHSRLNRHKKYSINAKEKRPLFLSLYTPESRRKILKLTSKNLFYKYLGAKSKDLKEGPHFSVEKE